MASYQGFPGAPPGVMLGLLIGSYCQLSDSDKLLFQQYTGLQPVIPPEWAEQVAETATMQQSAAQPIPAVVVQSAPLQAVQPVAPSTVPGGSIRPQYVAVAQRSAVAVPNSGTTIDPKTGKVYRRQAPAVRPQSYLELKNRAESARRILGQYMANRGFVHDVAGKVTRRRSDQTEVTGDTQLAAYIEAVRAANAAERDYRRTHPEQFRGPVARTQRSVVPTENLPSRGSSSSGGPSSDKGKGVHTDSKPSSQSGDKPDQASGSNQQSG